MIYPKARRLTYADLLARPETLDELTDEEIGECVRAEMLATQPKKSPTHWRLDLDASIEGKPDAIEDLASKLDGDR